MSAASQAVEISSEAVSTQPWSIAAGIAFRFCVLYFGLYCLSCQILGGLIPIPVDGVDIPDLSTPLRPLVFWTAAHVFGFKVPLVFQGSGSGDKTFDWVLTFCVLVIAVLATAAWSALDRKPRSYDKLARWFRIFIRFAVAGQMMAYGFAKAVPLQMPFPYLAKLLEPYGNFSPMGVLWSSVGASPSYEIFIGVVEIVSGLLLIVPRTTMLGALLCLMDGMEIFMLNMTYDIPVKLFAFHLILLSLLLLAPDMKRLTEFLLLNRATHPAVLSVGRVALVAQILFGVWLFGNNAYGAIKGWSQYGGGRAKSELYGIWDVEQMSVDNQIRSPLLNDYGRWQRIVFDFPKMVSFQRMDSTFAWYGCKIDAKRKSIELSKDDDKKWKAALAFNRMKPDQMTLDGNMDGHKVRLELKLVDRNKFMLVSRGFHWVQEYPFNR